MCRIFGAARLWAVNIAIAFDQLANALIGGDPDETISSRAGKARRRGAPWACLLCGLLDMIDPRHCAKAREDDEGRRSVWAYLREGRR